MSYGWVIVAVAFIAAFSEVSFYNPVLGVFVRPLEHEFGWNRLTVALAITMGNVGGALLSPVAGAALDRRGPRLLVGTGAAVMGMSLLALSLTQTLWWFYFFFFFGRATAVGAISLAISVVVSNWFIRNRGMAMGIALLGSRAGMALLPLMVQLVLLWSNWRVAWLVLGIVVLAVAVVPSLRFLRRRPEDIGLLPDGETTPTAGPTEEDDKEGEPEEDWTLAQAARTPAFWLVTLATSHVFIISGSVNLHQMPHLVDQGLSPMLAVGVVSTSAVFGGIGGLLAGILQARLGGRWTLAMALTGAAAGLVILINADNPLLAYGYGMWYGLSFGAMFTMTQVIYAEYFGRKALGRIRGAVAPLHIAFNAAGPPLAGWAFDVSGSYTRVFSAFVILLAIAVVWMLLAVPPRRGVASRPV